MVNLRYPCYRESNDRSTSGPSVDGFAFSCCAAALPVLMRSTAPAILYSLGALVRVAVPLIVSPLHDCSTLNEIETSRFQHLINRIEQVLLSHKYFALRLSRFFLSSAESLTFIHILVFIQKNR